MPVKISVASVYLSQQFTNGAPSFFFFLTFFFIRVIQGKYSLDDKRHLKQNVVLSAEISNQAHLVLVEISNIFL